MVNQDIRWRQRFENFQKAFFLLREVIENKEISQLSSLEKEGLAQRFIFTFELAWKTLRDKMQGDGIWIEKVSPRYILKLAYQNKYIKHIELWLEMISDRNLMSHNYDEANFNKLINNLFCKYYSILKEFYNNIDDE